MKENNYTIPKTKQQEHFEMFAPVYLKLLAELTEENRTKVFEYITDLHNLENVKS